MKSSRAEIHRGVHAIPDIRFDDQKMTSFAGLVVFQHLFRNLDLKRELKRVFGDVDRKRSFWLGVVVLQLVVHVLIGFRRIRDRDYYATDPLVCRVVGVAKLPDVATISRTLCAATAREVLRLRALLRRLVLDRMAKLGLATVTLDFDGSVLSTRRHAEGSAIGYNKKRKGSRSYYPLFCTVSQTGQFLDILHRPGNVHDSRDSEAFINEMIAKTRATLPQARIEARFDAAFFSEKTLKLLEEGRVEYSVSVPFERFPGLERASFDEPAAGSASTTSTRSSRSTGSPSPGQSRRTGASSSSARAELSASRGRSSSTFSSRAITSSSTRPSSRTRW